MTEDDVFKVLILGDGRYIRMPKDSSGYYLRRVCHDGAVTFLPITMPEPPRPKTAEELRELKEELEKAGVGRPITCQSAEPRGGVQE